MKSIEEVNKRRSELIRERTRVMNTSMKKTTALKTLDLAYSLRLVELDWILDEDSK